MSSATAGQDQNAGGDRPRGAGRRKQIVLPTVAPEEWLLLASSGWYVRLDEVLDRPTVAVLATEDACWHFADTDWNERRPHLWQRTARAVWVAEGERLEDKRERLVELTRQVRTLRPQLSPKRLNPKRG